MQFFKVALQAEGQAEQKNTTKLKNTEKEE